MAEPKKDDKAQEPIDYDKTIKELIPRIDSEKSLFTFYDDFHGNGVLILDAAVFLILAIIIWYLPSTTASLTEKIALSVATLAVVIYFCPY